jgi:hypothetical protein
MLSNVDFPEPEPHNRDKFSFFNIQVDPFQNMKFAFSGVIRFSRFSIVIISRVLLIGSIESQFVTRKMFLRIILKCLTDKCFNSGKKK